MHRGTIIAVALALLVAGCLTPGSSTEDPSGPLGQTGQAGSSDGNTSVNGTIQEELTHTRKVFNLSWSEVRVHNPVQGVERLTDANCIAVFDTVNGTVVDRGEITVDWQPPDIATSSETRLRVFGGPHLNTYNFEHRVQGPTEVDITGWNLTNPDFTISLVLGLVGPDDQLGPVPASAYAAYEHEATITFDAWHTGAIGEFGVGSCT